MRHRSGAVLALIAPVLATPASAESVPAPAPHGVTITVSVTGLRSAKGRVMACLMARASVFPECQKDPQARPATVPAGTTVGLHFDGVPPGQYAISLFHDENANGKLDKQLILPREGYGFSRDAPVRFGPPSFASAAFTVGTADQHQTIRMRYMF